jgi:hypothetical protein
MNPLLQYSLHLRTSYPFEKSSDTPSQYFEVGEGISHRGIRVLPGPHQSNRTLGKFEDIGVEPFERASNTGSQHYPQL